MTDTQQPKEPKAHVPVRLSKEAYEAKQKSEVKQVGLKELTRFQITYTTQDSVLTTEVAAFNDYELMHALAHLPARQIVDITALGTVIAVVYSSCCEPEEPTQF
jgi:hypothetical protein